MTWDEYAIAWSDLHGGFDPATASPLVRGWVRLAYRGGRLLGRLGVGPGAVTAAGLLLCAAVPVAAAAGPGGLLAGGMIVLLASVADGLDGAVAVVTRRASRIGFVYDSVADRLGEAAWLAAFWVGGAPGWLVVAAGTVSWLHEYVRARATAVGMAGIGAVTVAERPTRAAVALAGLVLAGVTGLVRDTATEPVLTVGAAAWLTLAVAGLAHLAMTVHRELSP